MIASRDIVYNYVTRRMHEVLGIHVLVMFFRKSLMMELPLSSAVICTFYFVYTDLIDDVTNGKINR